MNEKNKKDKKLKHSLKKSIYGMVKTEELANGNIKITAPIGYLLDNKLISWKEAFEPFKRERPWLDVIDEKGKK